MASLHCFAYAAATSAMGCDFEAIVDSPTAASHTYKVTIVRVSGTGTATVLAASSPNSPMHITVEDIGAIP